METAVSITENRGVFCGVEDFCPILILSEKEKQKIIISGRGLKSVINVEFYCELYKKSKKDQVLRRRVDRYSRFLLANNFLSLTPFGFCSSFEVDQDSNISPKIPAWEGDVLYFSNPAEYDLWKKNFSK
jgi:hypothetical protein